MNEQLTQFFVEKEKHLQNLERARREEVLRAAGLVEEIREYVTSGERRYGISYQKETVDGETRYFMRTIQPIDVTDEEFRRIEALLNAQKAFDDALANKKQAQKYEEEARDAQKQLTKITFLADGSEEGSGSAKFMQLLAWVLWIGGIIVAIMTAQTSVEVPGYYSTRTSVSFDWVVFLTTAITYIVAGGFAMALSGICSNLHYIASRLIKTQFRVEKKQERYY